jgi:hypothetical protein
VRLRWAPEVAHLFDAKTEKGSGHDRVMVGHVSVKG